MPGIPCHLRVRNPTRISDSCFTSHTSRYARFLSKPLCRPSASQPIAIREDLLENGLTKKFLGPTQLMSLETTYRRLPDLKRWDQNYRVGNVPSIIASIVRFGFNGALRTSSDGTVYAGNHALIALQTMRANGAQAPKGIEIDEGGEWLIRCVEVGHLSRLEAQAFAVADNRTQELGHNDPERLAAILSELQAGDTGLLEAAGYSESELAELFASIESATKLARQIPEPEDPESPDFGDVRPKPGDAWKMCEHLLICGDSTSEAARQRLGFQKPALCLTDPPYVVGYEGIRRRPDERTPAERGQPFKDSGSVEQLLGAAFDSDAELIVLTFPLAKHFHAFAEATKTHEMLYELVWVKNHFAFNMRRRYQQQHEMIYVFRRPGRKGNWNVPKSTPTIFEIDKPSKNEDHPTIKPAELWSALIEYHSAPGDIVFDPFVGSGTTVVCAEQLGRKCRAVELEPRYCEVTMRRWEQLTGLKSELFEDGPPLEIHD